MNKNHNKMLPPTLIWCHFVTVLHINRSRKFTVIKRQVKAIVLASHWPSTFPDEFIPPVLDAVTKLYTITDW